SEEQRALELNPDAEYRANAKYMLSQCELHKGRESTRDDERRGHFEASLRYLDDFMVSQEIDQRSQSHATRAILLDLLGRRTEANAESKRAIAMGDLPDDLRKTLEKRSLPFEELRVVSMGQDKAALSLGIVVAKGVVVNEGSDPAMFVRVIVECKDRTQKLVGTGSAYVEPTRLGPGESGSFEVHVNGPLAQDLTCLPRVARN